MAVTPPKPNRTVRGFVSLAKDYYDETFERYPVAGSGAGLKKFNGLLGRARPSVSERQLKLARRTLGKLEAMPVHEFEGDPWLDRLTLRSHLRREIMDLGDTLVWQTNPQIYLDTVANGIYGLLVRHADDLRPVGKALVSRIRAVARYLDEAGENCRTPIPLWVDLTAAAAPGVCDLIESLAEPLAKVTPHSEQALKRWTKEAAKAVRRYAGRVGRRKTGPEGGFALGLERFEATISDRLGMNLTAREAVAAAHHLAEGLKAELKREARRFHARKAAHEILEEAAAEWRPAGRDLLSAYRKQTRVIRSKFCSAGMLTFPRGETLKVQQVPDFMAHQFPTAAYSSPGPFDRDQTGIFWVNDLSLKRDTAKAKAAEIAQHFGIELTCAHEAYPGHHVQFVIQNKHASPVRRMADHAIYYEGWTLWCEQMSADLKVSDNPYLKLIQLHDALWRANRIVIDCGLQTGAMSYAAACRRLQREVGFTQARARADVNWYTSSPTVPMSYLLGKMEVLRLKRQRVDRGGWTLKEFNNWILSFGAIPWSWIEASGL